MNKAGDSKIYRYTFSFGDKLSHNLFAGKKYPSQKLIQNTGGQNGFFGPG